MNRIGIISLLAVVCLCAFASAEPPSTTSPSEAKPTGIPDPRSAMFPVILYHNQKNQRAGLNDPLLVFARWDTKPSNQILGVEGTFTDGQILAGLRKFYQEWRPPAGDISCPRPQLILAQQNWGCGAVLFEPLKALSAEFGIDVYQLYPVLTQIESKPGHPTPSDKRLAELIKGAGQ